MQFAKPSLFALATIGFFEPACSFPTIEYEQPNAVEVETACAAPTVCMNDVSACNNKAQAEQNMCAIKCSMGCVDCESNFDRSINICVAECETCSANNGCANATESCKALLGVP